MKKIHLGLIATMVMGLLAFAGGIASAHTPSVDLACENGLTISLLYYNNSHDNSVEITIDGQPQAASESDFGSTFNYSSGQLDPYTSHTTKVVVVAWDDLNGNHGWSFTDNRQIGACKERPYTPSASSSLRCGSMSLAAEGFNPNRDSNAQWIIDGGTQVDHPFSGSGSWSRTLGLYKPHTVTFRVWYKDDGQKIVVYEKTKNIAACKEHIVYSPEARLSGPYCDPMYIATFDNRDSNRSVTFTWYRTSHGAAKTVTKTVAAGKLFKTTMKHVDGKTITKIRARGETLISIRAAKGGHYPAPKGQHC